MLARVRSLALLLTISVLTFYLTLVPIIRVPAPKKIAKAPTTAKHQVKKIVAYSLRKKIEIESESVTASNGPCSNLDFNASLIDFGGALWTEVVEGDFYVFRAFYDDRLEPFRYVRILGMVRGNGFLRLNFRKKKNKKKRTNTDIKTAIL